MSGRAFVGIGVLVLVHSIASGCRGTATPVLFSPSPVPPTQAVAPPRPSGYSAGYTLSAVGLSGVVFEVTASGRSPLEGVTVYCDACGDFGHSWTTTDGTGEYRFSRDIETGGGVWLSNALTPINARKPGYGDPAGLPPLTMTTTDPTGWRDVRIVGDTRLDIELVRR